MSQINDKDSNEFNNFYVEEVIKNKESSHETGEYNEIKILNGLISNTEEEEDSSSDEEESTSKTVAIGTTVGMTVGIGGVVIGAIASITLSLNFLTAQSVVGITQAQCYFELTNAVVTSVDDINNFDTFKKVVEDIQANKDTLGIEGAFTSSGMDSSSDWRFKTHLANLPVYYEYQKDGITSTEAIKGTYLDNYKNVWDLYINNSTCEPSMISSKTVDDASSEFALGEAVFYQNGTWAFNDITGMEVADEDMGMLPIYIGVDGEENQGLCTGSENYWCVNKNAKEEDIKATLDFLAWVVESDTGREALANDMKFVTPFTTMTDYLPENPLVKANQEYNDAKKTPVSWNFTTMPSENWKNGVGSALLEYAQGTGTWDKVVESFVDGWGCKKSTRSL